jgi:hypothetical protein
MTNLEGPLSWSEAIRRNIEEHMRIVGTSLYKVEKPKNSITSL